MWRPRLFWPCPNGLPWLLKLASTGSNSGNGTPPRLRPKSSRPSSTTRCLFPSSTPMSRSTTLSLRPVRRSRIGRRAAGAPVSSSTSVRTATPLASTPTASPSGLICWLETVACCVNAITGSRLPKTLRRLRRSLRRRAHGNGYKPSCTRMRTLTTSGPGSMRMAVGLPTFTSTSWTSPKDWHRGWATSDGYRPPEDPLVGVALVGLGRMMLSYPGMPADVLAGREVQTRLVCRTFSDCTTAPRAGLVSGCFPIDPFYKEHPQRVELAAVKKQLTAS
jgi:hypothetical protein